MAIKSTYLNGELEEEVYIKQCKGFYSSDKPNFVWKLRKDLYGINQTPRAWYSKMERYL